MRIGLIPDRRAIAILGASALAILVTLLIGAPVAVAAAAAAMALGLLTLAVGVDFAVSRRAWRQSPPRLTRRLPAAFALAIQYRVHLVVEHHGAGVWQLELYDTVDAAMTSDGLPL